ncbi:MAG: DUF6503 family protein [Saprospiraceae bacterium]|nr:DUF6503 family protein [Saprospiraceae bacterium]
MKKIAFICLLLSLASLAKAQLTAVEILQKTIKVHDTKHRWQKLKANFDMRIVRDKHADRYFTIGLNLPKKSFFYKVKTDSVQYAQGFEKEKLVVELNGKTDISEINIKKHDLSQTRTQYLKEVYEYLLLLPMRLQMDKALLSKNYSTEVFNNANCYKLTIQYEPINENETWHFFIDTQNFMLKGYQFYVKDKTTNGEYIYLEDYALTKGILMPKTKRWFWNKDNSVFRTDRILRCY